MSLSRRRRQLKESCASLRSSIGMRRMNELRAASQSGELVIWAGSAISTFSPASIPAGETVAVALQVALVEANPTLPEEERCRLRSALKGIPFELLLHYGRLATTRRQVVSLVQALCTVTEPNGVHEVVAAGLESDRVAAVLTPNFDEGMELVTGSVPHVVVSERDVGPLSKVLFKVHGTVGQAETLVCELPQEAILEGWKVDYLRRLVAGRALLVIGYSGVDFDLVPQLRAISHVTRATTWLTWEKRSLNWMEEEAAAWLTASGAAVLSGDLRVLLPAILEMPPRYSGVTTTRGAWVSNQIRAIFSPDDLRMWTGIIAGYLGFGRLGLTLLKGLPRNRPVRERTRGRCLTRVGLYGQAVRAYCQEMKAQRVVNGMTPQLAMLLDETVYPLAQAGRYVRALMQVARLSIACRQLPHEPALVLSTDERRERRHVHGLFWRTCANVCPVKVFRRRLLRRAQGLLQETEPVAANLTASYSGAQAVSFLRLKYFIALTDQMRREAEYHFAWFRRTGERVHLRRAHKAAQSSRKRAIWLDHPPGIAKGCLLLGRIALASGRPQVAAEQLSQSWNYWHEQELALGYRSAMWLATRARVWRIRDSRR